MQPSDCNEQPLVVLFQPPTGRFRRDDRCQSHIDDQTVRIVLPPMELATMASVLENQRCCCVIRDYPALGFSAPQALEDLVSLRPQAVITTLIQPSWNSDLSFLAQLRLRLPELVVVVRGETCETRLEELSSSHEIDLVLIGEPEQTAGELAKQVFVPAVPRQQLAEHVRDMLGVAWRSNGTMRTLGHRPLIEPLDLLPFPARHLLDHRLYRSPESGRLFTTIETSRGCPHKCIFCPAPQVHGRRVRLRSPEHVLQEIESCYYDYNLKEFLFNADTFTYNKAWVTQLCHLLIERRLPIRWGCNSRVDTVDQEMLSLMRQAGCWIVGVGVESGTPETLLKIRKGFTVEQVRHTAELCRKTGIRFHAFFVIGFPWQTVGDLEQEVHFIKALDPDFFDINLAYPLPGTELYDLVQQEGWLDVITPEGGGYAQGVLRTATLTPEELTAFRCQALLRLYLRPRYIARTLWQAGSGYKIWRYLLAALRRTKELTMGGKHR